MRRVVPVTIFAAFLAGCSTQESATPRNPPTSVKPVPPSSTPAAEPVITPTMPPGFEELILPANGQEDLALPKFSHTGKGYTLVIHCVGGGKIEIKRDKEPALKPWPCDGVQTFHRVRSDVHDHSLTVDVTGRAQWTVRVVDGLLN